MKKIYYAIVLLICLSSCSLFRQPAVLLSSTLDYSDYQRAGFFLSESNGVSFPYEPIASVSSIQISGYKIKTTGERQFQDDVYQKPYKESFTTLSNEYLPASRAKALEQLVKEAKSKGANAIINLEIKPIIGISKDGYTYLSGYTSTGMAIKK